MRRATAELGLENVDVVEGYVQQWSNRAGACDLVTSRKVGRPDMMVERSAPLLAPGGAVALWPGRSDFEEGAEAADTAAEAADTAPDAAGLRLAQVHTPAVGESPRERVVKHLYLYVETGES